MQYYRLWPEMAGLALPADNEHWRAHRDLYLQVERPGRIVEWPVLPLVLEDDAELVDALRSIDGFDVHSSRLREVIESVLGPEDEVQWLPCTVTDDAGTVHDCWVPNPLSGPESLDEQRTVRTDLPVPQPLIKAVYDPDKVAGRHVLKYPYGSTPVVSEAVRQAVEQAGCTGVEFTREPLVTRAGSPTER